MRPELPIDAHLPELVRTLATDPCLVLVAPPGAGKTTRLPPALISAPWMADKVCLVLEPRRIAARAAARRVAAETGTRPGELAGYQVRHERAAGPATRILYCTEGILTARLQSDPFLEGVGAVVLDEFHERSLDADLCLAFLKEIRAEARHDLRLVVCSATLDPGPVARFLDARTRIVPGSLHPVEIEYLDKPPEGPPEETASSGVRSLWPRRPGGRGDLLVFLPGAGEIQRTRRALEPWAASRNVALVPLHGELPPEAQDAAIDPAAGDRVILSTNVAETSLTLPSVTAVVDAGLVKLLRHDPATGMDRLELIAAGRDSCDQRAGRAGRVGPGVALRLWTRHDHLGRPERLAPEALRADLARAVLEIAAWGHPDPAGFGWFEPPQPERLAAARELLRELGALDDSGPTPLGKRMLALPLHPRLARMLLEAVQRGFPRTGAAMGALLAERDILRTARAFSETSRRGLHDSDLLDRMELLEEAERAGFDPGRCRGFDVDASTARVVARDRDRLARMAGAKGRDSAPEEKEVLRLLFHAFPDRVGRRREEGSRRFVMAGGGGGVLSEESLVRRAPFIVALRVEAGRRGERSEAVIRWASAVEPSWLSGSPLTRAESETWFDSERGKVCAVERTLYRAVVLSERAVPPDPGEAAALLAREAARDPETALRPDRDTARLLGRMAFLARAFPGGEFPAWDGARWETLLSNLTHGRTSFEELRREDLGRRILASLSPAERRTLAKEAPEKIAVPSGREVFLDYPAGGPPVLSVKMQEVFGWASAPSLARGRVPVLLHLLGPHGRPLQVTSDLASFWKNGYPEVRKEMRGRYPRHDWPEDPAGAVPSRGVKRRRN